MQGYPAFAFDGRFGDNQLLESCPSAVGLVGFVIIDLNDRTDAPEWKVARWLREGHLRHCSIIPRGHPARSK